ncbi:hypothetical protein L7F22_008122 [Adiantum nelumboides]|nr:hypothetical protein [Adiantum nelumboides]
MENSNEHMMQQMMQQFVAFFQQQRVMQQLMNLEDRMRKARQCVIEKLDRFDGRDISKFCRAYEEAMEDNGIDDSVAIKNFHLIVKPELRGPIEELQGQHSVSWSNFKVALKAEYFLEDSQRVTKQTFIKWVQMKNKGLTSRGLLREFEKKFDQLSTGEQQSLRSEKVELFVQAADSCLQKNLVQLLEDPIGELGLTNDWDAIPAAINLLVKRQKRIDKSIVVDSHEDFEENGIVEKIVEKPKASSSPTLEGKEKPKVAQSSTLDDSTMDDLIKGIQELNLNLKAVRLEKSSSSEKPKDLRPKLCIWCDNKKVHLTQTGQPLCTNFGRGGMKKIAGEMAPTTSTYAMQVYKDENEEEVKASTNLWPHALWTTEAGKVTSFTLRQAGDSIRETTGWTDPVDSLLVYAYIAKAQAN